MSYEFTKLGAVEALTEMPENANALVEVDGAIKRMPASALGGGRIPAPVVILPETELKLDDGNWLIPTPLSATPTEGKTCTVTCNGVAYDCPVFNYPGALENTLVMGATKEMGLPGGNDDAPFVVMLLPGGDNGMYGMCMYDGEVDSVTLSIVQVAATSGGGGGASAMIVNIDPSTMTIDKPFSDVHAAVSTGEIVHFLLKDSSKTSWCYPSECTANEIVAFYIYFSGGILQAGGLKISSDGKVAPIGS